MFYDKSVTIVLIMLQAVGILLTSYKVNSKLLLKSPSDWDYSKIIISDFYCKSIFTVDLLLHLGGRMLH